MTKRRAKFFSHIFRMNDTTKRIFDIVSMSKLCLSWHEEAAKDQQRLSVSIPGSSRPQNMQNIMNQELGFISQHTRSRRTWTNG